MIVHRTRRGVLLAALAVGCGSSSGSDLFKGGDGPGPGGAAGATDGGSDASGGVGGIGGAGAVGGIGGSGLVGGTGATGGVGVGGVGGTGAVGGVGGSGATGGSGTGGSPPVCDPMACPGDGTNAPCCINNECGLFLNPGFGLMGCVETDSPGVIDAQCPIFPLGPLPILGCCRAETNTCGYEFSSLNLGCLDPAQLGTNPGGPCGP